MKFTRIILLSAIISLCPLASQAQSQSGGMKTLYVGKDNNTSRVPYTAITDKEAAQQKQERDALARVLEKYENLNDTEDHTEQKSQDQATQSSANALPQGPKHIAMPPQTKAEAPPMPKQAPMASGFASIIQDYKESKKNRSRIRTRTITP